MEFQSNFSVPNVPTTSQAKGNTRDWNDKRWNHWKPGASTRTGYDDFENDQFISGEEPCNNYSLWKKFLSQHETTISLQILHSEKRHPFIHRILVWYWSQYLDVPDGVLLNIPCSYSWHFQLVTKHTSLLNLERFPQGPTVQPILTNLIQYIMKVNLKWWWNFLPQKAYESIEFTTFQIPVSPVDPDWASISDDL